MVYITALSQYLSEDLNEYFKTAYQFTDLYTGTDCQQATCIRTEQDSDCRDPDSVHTLARGCSEPERIGLGTPIPDQRLPGGTLNRVPDRGADVHGYNVSQTGSWAVASIAQCARPEHAAAVSLTRSLAKKFRDEITDQAEANAYAKFIAVNNSCDEWSLNTQFSWEDELVGLLKQEIDNFLHPNGEQLIPSEHAIFDRGSCGPGASLGANGVDFYTKLFSSHLTATSLEVYYQYAGWCAADPKWRDAEFDRLTSFGLPSIIHESSVTFVPKNRDTLRTICTEPNLNMYAQLGIGAILEDRLQSYYGIDFAIQPSRNAELARLGSIGGAIDTIDLESASDSIGLKMLETILPEWFFETLLMYRSPCTRVRGERVKLNMVSTMGNGYTFPLQTIIFTCAVQAVAKQFGASMRRADLSWSPWGVFGDDIAIPSFMTGRVVHLLGILGFRVNREKSFTDKYLTFRESCGSDYFLGHNVRGVYIKTLATPQSRFIAINLLNDWSARWGIPLRRTIGYLRDSVRVLAIPPWVSEDAGIRVPLLALYSGHLHVYRSIRWRYSYLFKYYEAEVPSLRVLDDSIAIPRNLNRVPRRMYNPQGLLIAAIGGYILSLIHI